MNEPVPPQPHSRIRHMCPTAAGGAMQCCGRSVYEIPRIDILTLDPEGVTCPSWRRPAGTVDYFGARDYATIRDTGDEINPTAPDPTPDEITDPAHPDFVEPWTP